jgi:hypothetical protein
MLMWHHVLAAVGYDNNLHVGVNDNHHVAGKDMCVGFFSVVCFEVE